jgi:aryl carrier-like protein
MDSTPDAIDLLAVPQTELQALIRSLWSSVLKLDESLLGINDDFFTLGGDSLLAIRHSSAARAAGLQLLVTDVIRNPTIHTMEGVAAYPIATHDVTFDEVDILSVTLEHMSPADLTLLKLDQEGLDSLRNDLLPKHGWSVRFVFTLLRTFPVLNAIQRCPRRIPVHVSPDQHPHDRSYGR